MKACLHIANSLFGKQEAGELHLFQINRFPRKKKEKGKKPNQPTRQTALPKILQGNRRKCLRSRGIPVREPTRGCVGSRGVCPCSFPALPRPQLLALPLAGPGMRRPLSAGHPREHRAAAWARAEPPAATGGHRGLATAGGTPRPAFTFSYLGASRSPPSPRRAPRISGRSLSRPPSLSPCPGRRGGSSEPDGAPRPSHPESAGGREGLCPWGASSPRSANTNSGGANWGAAPLFSATPFQPARGTGC